MDKETWLKENLNKSAYKEVAAILFFDQEMLRQKWKEWYGDPSL